jgi:hypothetical protein
MDGLRMLREEECADERRYLEYYVVVRDLDQIRRGLWIRERATQ